MDKHPICFWNLILSCNRVAASCVGSAAPASVSRPPSLGHNVVRVPRPRTTSARLEPVSYSQRGREVSFSEQFKGRGVCVLSVCERLLLLFSPLWCSSFKQQIHFKFMMFFSLKYVDITKNYKQCFCFLVNTHIWIWCLDKAKSICTILQSFHKHNLIRYTSH